jgi:hypothetical protein
MATMLMRDAYEKAGELKYFFDKTVPVDLWRGQKEKDHKQGNFVLAPITEKVEFITGDKKRIRLPDVEVFHRNGEPWIKGCRTTRRGDQHWGISLFDRRPAFAARSGWVNFKVPKGTPIPPSLAVTQDGDVPGADNHYSIAPKDDMPLALFVAHLKEIALHIKDW